MSTLTPTATPGAGSQPEDPAEGTAPVLPRSWKTPIMLSVFAVAALLGFGLTAGSGDVSTFALSLPGADVQLDPIEVPTRPVTIFASVLCLALAAYATWLARARRPVPGWVPVVFGLAWITAFLVWAVAGKSMNLTGLLEGSLLLAVPLVFGALSGVLCERSGVVNISIEGQLLSGAFLAAVVASLSDSLYLGLIAAPVAGLFFGWLLAVFTVKYFVDQIIVGVTLNILAVGLTSFLYSRLLAPQQDVWNSPGTLQPIKIPLLGDIPVLGAVLFDQSVVVYLMYVVVAVVHVGLFHSRWGLRVRAVGEHPTAADTVGIKVNRVRWRNVLLGGMVAGLGGAYFTIGSVGAFGEEMTGGTGFIALAAMIFGRWSPIGSVFAALLFGFAGQLQSVLSILDSPIPSEFMLMAPYLATIFAVAGLVGRVRAPAADGQPYIKS